MTKSELLDKIKRAEKNPLIDASLKASLLKKYNAQLAELEKEEPKKEKSETKKEVKENAEKEDNVKNDLAYYKTILKNIDHPTNKRYVKKNIEKIISELEAKSEDKKETKSEETEEERCQKIIRDAKAASKKARESAKKSAKKPEVTKAKERIERTYEIIENKIEKGSLTKAEVAKLIVETKEVLKMLEKALKSL